MTIAPAEHAARCERLRSGVLEAGYEATLVWARGGGALDGHGSLLYLTGTYVEFPAIPDFVPAWSDRGYAALLMVRDRMVLVGQDLEALDPGLGIEVRTGITNLAETVAELLGAARVKRVALVGGDAMSWRQRARIEAQRPQLELGAADELLLAQRMIKSEAEQAVLRRAAEVGLSAVSLALEAAGPGVAQSRVTSTAIGAATASGARVANVFVELAAPTRAGERAAAVDGRGMQLQAGDVISVDLSGSVDGYFFDLSRGAEVGTADEPARRLLEIARGSVSTIVEAIAPGRSAAEVAEAGFRFLDEAGYDRSGDEFEAFGHGLGIGFEPPWLHPADETILRSGMVICVEKTCVEAGMAASHEETVLVGDGGSDVLTR